MKKIVYFFTLLAALTAAGQNRALVDSLRKQAEEMPDDTNKVNIYIQLSKQYDLYSSTEQINNLLRARELATEIKFRKALRRIYPQLITALYERNMYGMALEHCLEYIEFCKLEKYDDDIVKVYNMLGNLLARDGRHKEALQYYNLKKTHDLKTEDYMSYAMSLNNLSTYFYQTDQYDSALVYSLWAVQMFKRNNMASEMGGALLNAAQVNLRKEKYRDVLEKAGEAMEVYNAIQLPQGSSRASYYIGEAYAGLGQTDSAFHAFQVALKFADSLHLLKVQRDCYNGLSKMYANQKNYKDAYEYSILANRYEDSTTVSIEKGKILEMQTRYELEKIRNITAQKQFQKVDSKINKTVFLIFVCALMVVVARRLVRRTVK